MNMGDGREGSQVCGPFWRSTTGSGATGPNEQ
jgi:hypothetical protein